MIKPEDKQKALRALEELLDREDAAAIAFRCIIEPDMPVDITYTVTVDMESK